MTTGEVVFSNVSSNCPHEKRYSHKLQSDRSKPREDKRVYERLYDFSPLHCAFLHVSPHEKRYKSEICRSSSEDEDEWFVTKGDDGSFSPLCKSYI